MSAFVAMGCTVEIEGAAPHEALAIERLFHERDRRFSRFREESELARVNRACAEVVALTPGFAAMVQRALRAAASTSGLVDPTLGEAIESAGYTCNFEELEPSPEPVGAGPPGRWGSVRLRGRFLIRPQGLKLDLNGVVKGQTVDDALALIGGDGFVSAGGDIATRGAVDVALPGNGAVRMIHGGLATSGTATRRWLRAGRWQHHLIDPRTGRAATSPWEQVTVSAATCLQADVAAKAAFLLGSEGPEWLDQRALSGRFLCPDGDVVVNQAWLRSVPTEAAA
jgi:thiamine biosynthesis lipoprotein